MLGELLNSSSSSRRHIFQQHMQTRVQLSWSSRLPLAFLADQRKCAQAAHVDHQVRFFQGIRAEAQEVVGDNHRSHQQPEPLIRIS